MRQKIKKNSTQYTRIPKYKTEEDPARHTKTDTKRQIHGDRYMETDT